MASLQPPWEWRPLRWVTPCASLSLAASHRSVCARDRARLSHQANQGLDPNTGPPGWPMPSHLPQGCAPPRQGRQAPRALLTSCKNDSPLPWAEDGVRADVGRGQDTHTTPTTDPLCLQSSSLPTGSRDRGREEPRRPGAVTSSMADSSMSRGASEDNKPWVAITKIL